MYVRFMLPMARPGSFGDTIARRLLGTGTMDADQREHARHFFNAQLARDERMGFYDAESVLFFKKALPSPVVHYAVLFPLIWLLVVSIFARLSINGWPSVLIAGCLAAWLSLGSFWYSSGIFYVFTTDRIVFIGPTLASAYLWRGYGPFQVILQRAHTRNEFLCIVLDPEAGVGYLNFYDREGKCLSVLLSPWTMYLVDNVEDLKRTLPELPLVHI
eukprot:TRINITY_DN14726_c0_g1_i1.p1 TRINITY_DN14726_c0_g1~~TRINITY_DN14726_c0_g1_i1.p1  ORF type:complete len:216 (-),score=39.81 TRINITY_DN14726_c0_g1_i1:451-1098(-)